MSEKVKKQLGRDDGPERPRAIPEKDLVRIWSVTTPAHAGFGQHAELAEEIAAWETRVREKGWLPQLTQLGTQGGIFLLGHALMPDGRLEARLEDLQATVQDVVGVVNRHQQAIQDLLSRKILRPV